MAMNSLVQSATGQIEKLLLGKQGGVREKISHLEKIADEIGMAIGSLGDVLEPITGNYPAAPSGQGPKPPESCQVTSALARLEESFEGSLARLTELRDRVQL